MNDHTRRGLYEQQIRLYGRVILSRENASWYLTQIAGSLKTPPIAVLPDPVQKVRQAKVAAR